VRWRDENLEKKRSLTRREKEEGRVLIEIMSIDNGEFDPGSG
jgi:hypothetical protein